jgi:hypothetical protein
MTRTATVFTAEYRARGYAAEDERFLREVLEEFGPVRLRPQWMPEAGGSTELSLLIAFIGGSMTTGLIEHLTGKLFDRLSDALGRFYRQRQSRDGLEPEMTLRISYDDIDLDLGPVTEGDIRRLRALATQVHEFLQKPPLAGKPVSRVVIGMVRDGERWEEPHLWLQSEDGARFWGISFELYPMITHILDTKTGLLGHVSPAPEPAVRADEQLL